MAADLMCPERTMGLSEADIDAEFDEHNIDVEEVLKRTQRSFSSRRHAPLYEAPEFVKRLNAFEEVRAGDDVVFTCQWKGFPKPSLKWYRDDVDIPDNDRFIVESDPGSMGVVSLLIRDICKKDEGAYKCKAENQEGVASTTGYLSVTGGGKDKTLASQKKEEKKQQQQQQQQNGDDEQQDDDPQLRKKNMKVQSDRMVSYPPHLRTIIEQKSVEEREAEMASNQPPSPLQDFIEKMQDAKAIGRGATWPFAAMGYNVSKDKDDDAQSHSSDTSVESQDFDRVTFSAKNLPDDDDDDVFAEQNQVNGIHSTDPNPQQNTSSENPQSNGCVQKIHCGSRVRPLVGAVASTTITPPLIEVFSPKNSISDYEMSPRPTQKTKRTREENILLGFPEFNLSLLYRLLDSPWGYFVPIISSLTFVASATDMSPVLFVLIMLIISFLCFRFLFPDHMKT